MSVFVAANWALFLGTMLAIALVVTHQRFVLVKPSVVLAIAFHVLIQFGATLEADFIETFLPRPWTFALLVHVFPLAVIGPAARWGGDTAGEVYDRLQRAGTRVR